MTIAKRLRLYLAGFLTGCVLVYFMLFRGTNRNYWLPTNRVKERVNKLAFRYSKEVECKIKCKQITQAEVKEILHNGKVNFSKSNSRGTLVPSYAIEGKTSSNKNLRVIVTIYEADSVAEITTAINMDGEKNDTCTCK
jgi:aromatic ring-opening dioxygenase catalytic subunit (LigB family)